MVVLIGTAYWISKMSIPVIENVTKVGRENVTE
jgi:hypothetical protein